MADFESGSEFFYDFACILCAEADKHIEAFCFCADCRMYLCERCLTLHDRFPSNRGHNQLDYGKMTRQASGGSTTHRNSETERLERSNSVMDTNNNRAARQERHEQRAAEIERLRERAGTREQKVFDGLLLRPLTIESSIIDSCRDGEINRATEYLQSRTISGINLCLHGNSGFFKYGRGWYDLGIFMDILKPRLAEFGRYAHRIVLRGAGRVEKYHTKDYNYVIYNTRHRGCVTKQELSTVLRASQRGFIADVTREEYFRRMRDDVYELLEAEDEDDDGDHYVLNIHYKRQLHRWLANIADNLHKQEYISNAVDPNSEPFPIPDDIRRDVTILRDWGEYYSFDDWDSNVRVPTSFDDEEYDDAIPGDADKATYTHEEFVRLCASHVDENIPDLDMSIDGEVAWREVEANVIADDKTTEKQLQTIAKRSARKKPPSARAMERHRQKLTGYFESRWVAKTDIELFVSNLQTSWNDFQVLCNVD